jgi:hypothetical protein
MKPSWLIQNFTQDEDIDRLIAEVLGQGMVCHFVDRNSGHFDAAFPVGDCVVAYGSLNFTDMVRKSGLWRPGAYYDRDCYECVAYYPHFDDFLLNRGATYAQFRWLPDMKSQLFENHGQDGAIFVRPSSGHKPFTGQVIYEEDFERDIKDFHPGPINGSDWIVVSNPRNVEYEWRFVVVDNVIVSGCQYRGEKGRRILLRDYSPDAYMFARVVLNQVDYRPDRAFTLDVCTTTSGKFYVIEINSFSSSGLYKMNLEPVVREVSRVALEDWGKPCCPGQ